MTKPRVLVIDDNYGDSLVDGDKIPAMQAAFIREVDPSGRCEFSFCSGQEGGKNSLPKVTDVVASGWPPSPGRAWWSLVLLDIAFFQKPRERDDEHWGFVVLEMFRERWPDLPVVMLTSEGAAKKTRANWGQADGFLPKPSEGEPGNAQAFLTRLYAFGLFPDLREGEARLAGNSLAILKVLQEARQFACDPLGSGRILYGETGTGKTELARFIHDEMRHLAGRSNAFRTWSAAGTNEDIAKVSLFGQWKGAHSEGKMHEQGEIEKADGGTFFLDEIASLPFPVQALFMESRRRNAQLRRLISRLGTFPTKPPASVAEARASIVPGAAHLQADHRIAVDVVMLTASNVNLHDEEVADSLGFRRDLLNDLGTPLYVPSLNDRREDIPEIFEATVRQIVKQIGRQEKEIDRRVFAELQSRDWTKKNIVALRQIAEHAVLAARDFDEILVRHLPPPLDLPNWAGSRPMRRPAQISVAPQDPASALSASSPHKVRTFDELLKILKDFEAPTDPTLLNGALKDLQDAYARLVLKLFGAALRATRDRRGETSSLSAVCKLLATDSLKPPESKSPESYMAYDVVLRVVNLCDVNFKGLSADRCDLLSDDPDVRVRVDQAIDQRRRPKKDAQ
jgi:DNA-binding NtrC family response regulator